MSVSKRVTFDEVGVLLDLFPDLDFWEEFTREMAKRHQRFCVCSSNDEKVVDNAYNWLKENYPNVESYKLVSSYKVNPYQLIFRCY